MQYKIIAVWQDRLLLETFKNGLALPCFSPNRTHLAETGEIAAFLQEKFGVMANVLQCVHDGGDTRVYSVSILESSSENDVHWASYPEAASLLSANDAHFSKEWKSLQADHSVPWFSPDWREGMERWVRKKLRSERVDFQQIRSWERSALYKIITDEDNYYFKAVPKIFRHEVNISSFLWESGIKYIPAVIAADDSEGWLLIKEIQGELLGRAGKEQDWREALLALAGVQKLAVKEAGRLREEGVPVRPLASVVISGLRMAVESLLKDGTISDGQFSRLAESTSEANLICSMLQTPLVPLSLDHGDFFGGNIILEEGLPIIYDWSDSSLSHPFLSVTVFLNEAAGIFSEEFADELLEAYLSCWAEWGSEEDLRKEYLNVQRIAPLFGLAVYQNEIFPFFQKNWDKSRIIQEYIQSWLDA
ncbi:aminoglycoside phosphotransferase family protein [Bacillus infantis]|uniref:aminoglycoside phosphotransferase family protein n=1 Tax=Bacillus infantis TaxID=324767 RepID=UPI003CEBE6D0